MSQISEAFCEATSALIDGAFKKLKFDKTVKAEIIAIEDLDSGKYKVKYQDSAFVVSALDAEKKYRVGQQVYVMALDGDFSSEKFILSSGTTKGEQLSDKELQELTNQYSIVSQPFHIWYGYNNIGPFGLIAGDENSDPEQENYKDDISVYPPPEGAYAIADNRFQGYQKQYEYIKLDALFHTELESIHNHGDYGLEVTFETFEKDENNNPINKTFIFGMNDFNGRPYEFSTWVPQSIILYAEKGTLRGLRSIKFYEKGFDLDLVERFTPAAGTYVKGVKYYELRDENYVQVDTSTWIEGETSVVGYYIFTPVENKTAPNLFVKDISLQFIQKKDLTETPYCLLIYTPDGVKFYQAEEGGPILPASMKLEGRLIYNNSNILEEKTCSCKWYQRDLSITVDSLDYDKDAGIGWKRIVKREEYSGEIPYSDVYPDIESMEFNVLTLNAFDDTIANREYKLVVIYNSSTTVSDTVTIFGLQDYGFRIERDGDYLELKWDAEGTFVGDWWSLDPSGVYTHITKDNYKNKIDIHDYLIHSSLIFYCQTYTPNGSSYIGPLSVEEYKLVPSEDKPIADVDVFFTGDTIFKYDANGDIPREYAEREKIIDATVVWNNSDVQSPYDVDIYLVNGGIEDGKIVDLHLNKKEEGQASQPKNPDTDSMLYWLWYEEVKDGEYKIHFKINQKFGINKINNILKLVITRTADQSQYTFLRGVIFLKDGDQGTNGTTYYAVIRPINNASDQEVLDKSFLFYYNGWKSSKAWRCCIYKDGVEINNGASTPSKETKSTGEIVVTEQLNGYTFTYKWTAENLFIAEEFFSSNGCFQVNGTGSAPSSNLPYFVKVYVEIKDDKNSKIGISCIQPINIVNGYDETYIDGEEEKPTESKFTLNNLPDYIQYNATGFHPVYTTQPVDVAYADKQPDNRLIFESSNTSLVSIDPVTQKLRPASTFVYDKVDGNNKILAENNTGILTASMDNNPEANFIHTIILYLNIYGNETINGWDGTKVDIGDDYILAPWMGAGEKDDQNRFSGVVMGKSKIGTNDLRAGLYGYQKGINSFGLMDNGVAFFGAPVKGHAVIIDGNDATIAGGREITDYMSDDPRPKNLSSSNNDNAMYLRLLGKDDLLEVHGKAEENTTYYNSQGQQLDPQPTVGGDLPDGCYIKKSKTKAIGVGWNLDDHEEKFWVDYSGDMHARNGRFGSKNCAVNIDGENAIIYGGGYNTEILPTDEHGDPTNPDPLNNGMYLRLVNPSKVGNGEGVKAIGIGRDGTNPSIPRFYVDYDGKMYANGATVSGNISATAISVLNGDVSYLTVGELLTSRRILKWLNKENGYNVTPGVYDDSSEDNFILAVQERMYYVSSDVVRSSTDSWLSSNGWTQASDNALPENTSSKHTYKIERSSLNPAATGGSSVNGGYPMTQAVDEHGNPLYWEELPTYDSSNKLTKKVSNGYPMTNEGQQIFATIIPPKGYTDATSLTEKMKWIVWTYIYKNEYIKAGFSFCKIPNNNVQPANNGSVLPTYYNSPALYFGAGYPGGQSSSEDLLLQYKDFKDRELTLDNLQKRGRGYILKQQSGFDTMFYPEHQVWKEKEIGMHCGTNGLVDLYGLRRTHKLDFSGWDSDGYFEEWVTDAEAVTEGTESNTTTVWYDSVHDGTPYKKIGYHVEKSGGYPVRIYSDDTGFSCDIVWQ